MPACFVKDKELLFDAINIESWLLPAIYARYINHVVWVRPRWAQQIPCGKHTFCVGESDKEIFVDSKLDYFINEGAYRCTSSLSNCKEVQLDVVELEKKAELSEITLDPFILDIDLDVFSTKNPFLELYKDANMYEQLKKIYILPKNYNLLDEKSISDYSMKKLQHLNQLEALFKHLDCGNTYESFEGIKNEQLNFLISTLKKHYKAEEIDYILIHNAGCTCDEIELPHHVSDRSLILQLIERFENFLKEMLNFPVIITISRSSSDEYCPSDQVEFIQSQVLDVLERVYKKVEIKYLYDT